MKNNTHLQSSDSMNKQTSLDLIKVSEIARHALKDLISSNKPAVPSFYEKSFYNTAEKMGESELIGQLNSSLPSPKKAALMVDGVSSIISEFNSELRQCRSGIDTHGGQLENKQEVIKQLVSSEVWQVLEKNLLGLQKANEQMSTQLVATETRLEKQEDEVKKLQRKHAETL